MSPVTSTVRGCARRLGARYSSLLRASTDEQYATRAREQVQTFAAEAGLTVAAWYTENESGAKLARPELFRLLADACEGDILLVEQVDRLSRLTEADRTKLKAKLAAKRIRVFALDLPTSWLMATSKRDDFTGRMFAAINAMLLDMLAAVARKDYDDRRRRQAQGQAKAKAAGLYRGRVENTERNVSSHHRNQRGGRPSGRPFRCRHHRAGTAVQCAIRRGRHIRTASRSRVMRPLTEAALLLFRPRCCYCLL